MKLTKLPALFSIFIVNSLYSSETIEKYFDNVYFDERLKFLKCIEEENLTSVNKVNTKCSISKRIKKGAREKYGISSIL